MKKTTGFFFYLLHFSFDLYYFAWYTICLNIMMGLSQNTNLLVEKISQSSQTTASYSRPQELVDGCRSVQVHFEPLQSSTSLDKDVII